MKKHNSSKESFLLSIPDISLEQDENNLTERCKFNFSYFDVQPNISQDFKDWNKNELVKLLNKLKEYSNFSLNHWKQEKTGKYPLFTIYGNFPTNTDFKIPKHIPIEAQWARFHMENKIRLVGFTIPSSYIDKVHHKTKILYDLNTFYIVYLDKEHKFYKTS